MTSKILRFPRGIEVTITPRSVVTDEFRKRIQEAFRDYTAGTAKEYQYQDKLAFINRIREINFKVESESIVNEHIRFLLENDGEVTLGDLVDLEQIANLMDEAVYRYKKDWDHWSGDHHLDEPACKFVAAAIQEVMNYKE